MVKHLQQHGNSLALVIDKPILDILKIDKSTPLEIEISEDPIGLRIVPMRGIDDERLGGHLAKGNRKYSSMLKRLAK